MKTPALLPPLGKLVIQPPLVSGRKFLTLLFESVHWTEVLLTEMNLL
jgi:hypothetical protein